MTSVKDTGDLVYIVVDDEGEPVYRIRPYPSRLNYVVDEWREITSRKDGVKRVDWVQLECYPSTLEHACTKVRDWMVMSGCKKCPADLTEIKKAITRSTTQIVKAIKEAEDG